MLPNAIRSRSLPLTLVVLSVAPAAGQEQKPLDSGLVEHTERRLIQLDVSFAPKPASAGRPLPELGPEHFELVIGGRRITIEYADRICDMRSLATGGPIEPRTVTTGAATYVFYVEHTLLSMAGQQRSLEMIERLVPRLIRGGNRGWIVSSGSRVVQSAISDDAGELLQVLRAVREDPRQTGESVYVQSVESRYEDILGQPTEELRKAAARAYQQEEARITASRLRRLSAIVGGLGEIAPPKAVFYFADAMRSRPGEHYLEPFLTSGAAGPFTEGNALRHTFSLDEVIRSANAQGARVYTIQAQGLQGISRFRLSRSPNDTGLGSERVREAEKSMATFAGETGGEMFFGGSDSATLGRIAERVEQDFGCMVLLGFYADELPTDRGLRVLLRLDSGAPAAEEVDRHFTMRTRAQLVVPSEAMREQSLLLAAHLSAPAADFGQGRAAVIPVGYEGGTFRALVQFVVRDTSAMPAGSAGQRRWDLGMTHVVDTEVRQDVSRRVEVSNPSLPIVFETLWEFPPGPGEIVAVGREQRLGQLASTRLELDWPDPEPDAVETGPIAVVQRVGGVFVRRGDGVEPEVRYEGPLAVTAVAAGEPIELNGLVCRGKGITKDLWILRRLVSTRSKELEPRPWPSSAPRCVTIRDSVRRVSPGQHGYEILVFDTPELRDGPLLHRLYEFAVDAVLREPGDTGAVEVTDADFASASGFLPPDRQGDARDSPALDVLLDRMARMAAVYADSALSFTVDEKTKVVTHNYVAGTRNEYVAPRSVYCYYHTEQGRLDDRRIEKSLMTRLQKRLARLEDVGDALSHAPDPIRNNSAIPTYVVRPYSWIGLFSDEARARYRYRIERRDKHGIWVHLEPRAVEPEDSDWYGDVLVEAETGRILKADGRQHRDVEELRAARAMLESTEELPLPAAGRTFVEVVVHAEFEHRAHGLRLPSAVVTKVYHHIIAEPRLSRFGRKRLAYEIVQKYKNYEFYGVRVDDRLREISGP